MNIFFCRTRPSYQLLCPLKTDDVKTNVTNVSTYVRYALAGGQTFPLFKLHDQTGAVVNLIGIRELWERGKLTDLVLQAKCDGTSSPSRLKHIINCVQYFHPVSSSDFRGLLELLSQQDALFLLEKEGRDV